MHSSAASPTTPPVPAELTARAAVSDMAASAVARDQTLIAIAEESWQRQVQDVCGKSCPYDVPGKALLDPSSVTVLPDICVRYRCEYLCTRHFLRTIAEPEASIRFLEVSSAARFGRSTFAKSLVQVLQSPQKMVGRSREKGRYAVRLMILTKNYRDGRSLIR